MIDSHCHLNFDDFTDDGIDVVVKRAKDAGVSRMLTICTKLEEADKLRSIAESDPDIFCTVGIHPHEAEETLNQIDAASLKNWLVDHTNHPKVIGFGETGLDYYYGHSPRDKQILSFRTHLEAAVQTDLPLSVHTRDAEEDTIELIRQFPRSRGVIHCFTGSPWLRDQALDIGFYISISGIITFNKAQELRDTIKDIPLERLLIETDAPFLAPVPFRGKKNEPSLIVHTAQTLADLKGVSLDDVSVATSENFYKLFSKAVS